MEEGQTNGWATKYVSYTGAKCYCNNKIENISCIMNL